MYLYWRVQTDLDEIGCQLILRHPNFQREFEKWARRNARGLAIMLDLTVDRLVHQRPNLN